MKPTRNLWPLGIILTFVLFGAGTATLVAFACSHKTDLVSANYYEQEIKFQKQIDRVARATSLGSSASVSYDNLKNSIAISLPPNSLNDFAGGRIQLYRPSAAKLDQEMALNLDSQGNQLVNAAILSPGLWKIRVSWTAAGQDYFIEQKVVVPRKSKA
jgi:nitrogen fixation protein FixH